MLRSKDFDEALNRAQQRFQAGSGLEPLLVTPTIVRFTTRSGKQQKG
jgi:hypothetical protein